MDYPDHMVSPATYDPTRAAELFRRLAHPTELVLRRAYPHIDRQQVADAVVDAVMRLSSTTLPDVELSLYRIARSRLRTRYRSEMRRQNRARMGCGNFRQAALSRMRRGVVEQVQVAHAVNDD